MTASSERTIEPGGSLRAVEGGGADSPRSRTSSLRARRWYRLAPLGDLLLMGAVLSASGLPLTSAVALLSATLVGSLISWSADSSVGHKASDLALWGAGRIALAMAVALPVAWADGALGSAALAAGVALVSIFLLRYSWAATTRAIPNGVRKAAIVGTGPLGIEIAEYLLENDDQELVAVGMVDHRVRGELPLPMLGHPDELEEIVELMDIDCLIVAFGAFSEAEMVPVLRRCEELPVEVVILPRFFELSIAGLRQEMWGFPLTRLEGCADRRLSWRLKRMIDIAGASFLLTLAAPVMAVVALAVRLSSPGPVFYRQKRVGYRGRVFEILKFRSMLVNDDGDTTWAVDNDSRITPVGRVIRLTHLDELPQLLNVLRGDMSLVGPRPMRPHFVKLFGEKIDRYDDRHRVPVGITGWSQVNGLSGDTSVEARVRLDNRYIESWSLRRDLLILFKTFPTVFNRGRE